MQHILEHFGVAIAAITGVLAARGKEVDLFGVIVLAMVTAFGGGTVRDLALGDTPVFWVRDSGYLLNAVITAVIVFYLVRFHDLPVTVLMVADAFVLALYTMVGARKALVGFAVPPTIAIAMGVITGVVGGIIRDVLTGQIPLVFRREIFLYATAAFFGAALYVLLKQWLPDWRLPIILGTLATLGLRLAGMRWKIALPVFRPKHTPSPGP